MTSNTSWPLAVLFDLDGTLIDSAPDIREALNEAFAAEGIAAFDLAEVKVMIGAGVPKLIERAFLRRGVSATHEDRDRVVDRFGTLYGPRATKLTTLLPGAAETLAFCRDKGVTTALVTNKPEAPARAILDHFGIADAFHLVIGGDAGPARKPAPDLLIYAARSLGIEIEDCLFVGDSENDVAAAKAAFMPVALLANGYTALTPAELDATHDIARLSELPFLFR